jgi:uncharacterized RDD family membrane protein YckC
MSFGPTDPSPWSDDPPNPYAPPSMPLKDHVTDPFEPDFGYAREHYELATLWQRFAGNFLDGMVTLLAAAILFIPALLILGTVENDNPHPGSLVAGAVGLIAISIWQMVLITQRGQSLGKIAMKTRIVKIEDQALPGFLHGVVLRAWLPALIAQIPFAGGCFSLIDPLFIFGEQRRCIHDQIASTIVIKA